MLQESNTMQAEPPRTKVYTVEDAAKLLCVSKGTVYNLIKEGKIKVLRIGNAIRIPKRYFDEWVDSLEN